MLKSIISNVLDKVAGDYIVGLSKEHLKVGFFSGEVKIENVSLNPNVLDMLDLPLNHCYSKINKLEVKVPFKNIGSKPVEVFLDGLYLVVTPKDQKDWVIKDYQAFKQKLTVIESYAAECVAKIAAKQSEKLQSVKNDGYFQKLTMKIIDNLQITIRNIHVRFEDTINKKYSWGFCLDKIESYTTNNEGIKKFIDRTIEKNKDEPMRKLLVISNAGIYWNANEKNFVSDFAEQNRGNILNRMIHKEDEEKSNEQLDFLLKVSLQVNLTMSNKGNFDTPEMKASLNIEHITFHLQKSQLQQIIELIEFISKYSNELAKSKRNVIKLESQEVERLGQIFKANFAKMISQEKDKSIECLTEQERQEFEEAVVKLDIDFLQEKTKKVVIDVQKQLKIKELEQQKQHEKRGFFSRLLGSSKSDQTKPVTEEDREQIDKFIEDNFSEEVLQSAGVVRPKEYVFFSLDYTLKGASIKLSNIVDQEVQCLKFSLHYIYGNVQLRDNNNEVNVNLQSIELSMIDQFLQSDQSKVIQILSPTIQNSKQSLLEFRMVSNPINEPHIDKDIDLKMRSIRFDFNPYFINRVTQFFDVNVKSEELKEQAREKFQEQIEEQQQSLSENLNDASVLKLKVELESPVIVLPFKNDGSLTNECWVLNLGNLSVNTVQDVLQPNLSVEMKALDMYDISLSNIELCYFSSIEYYNNFIINSSAMSPQDIQQRQLENKLFYTIEDFSIYIRITLVKGPAQGKINKPKVSIKSGIDHINLKLNSSIYKKILKIGDCINVPSENQQRDRRQSLEFVELEKNSLLKKATKTGIIYKRSSGLKIWERFHVVLSGGYLYFFKNLKDLKSNEYFWVKNSVITKMDENLVGFNNAFHIKNISADIYLACDNQKDSQQWIDAIDQTRTVQSFSSIMDYDFEDIVAQYEKEEDVSSPKTTEEDVSSPKKTEEDQGVNFEIINIEASFEIGKIQLSLFDDYQFQQQPFLLFQTNKLTVFYEQRNNKQQVYLSLGGLFLSDFLYKYKNESLNDFISSKSSQEGESELIKIGLVVLDKVHPEYQNIGLDLDVTFNTLTINIKPETLAKVLQFVKPDISEQEYSPQKESLQDILNYDPSTPTHLNSTLDIDSFSQISTGRKSMIIPDVLQENESILFQAKINVRKIQVVLINRINKLPMSDLSIKNIEFAFQQKSDEIFLKGSLGNLQVRDLTNFPNTIYLEEDWEKIKPQEIIGLLKKEDASSLLEVEFRSLNEGSNKIGEDSLTSFIKININSIHLNFVLKPILRTVDLVLKQIKGSISDPEQFIDENSIGKEKKIQIQQEQKDNEKEIYEPLQDQAKSQVRQNLVNPHGMSLSVVIQNPVITIKPNPNSTEYLEIDLGIIKVTNEYEKNGKRLLNCKVKDEVSETYSENFNISLSKMQIRVKREDNVSEMTKEFNSNININLVAFFDEYKYIYDEDIILDKTTIIKSHISPIIFRLSNIDYNLVMKCVSHNISYEDGCDKFFIYDWAREQESQVVIEKKKQEIEKRKKSESITEENQQKRKQSNAENIDKQDSKKDGLFFQLDMESLSIFALDKVNMPFARITLGKTRVISQSNDQGSSTSLFVKTLNGSCFRFDGQEYVETSLLGDLNIYRKYMKQQVQDLNFLVRHSIHKSQEGVPQEDQFNQNQNEELHKPVYEFEQFENQMDSSMNKKPHQIELYLTSKPNDDKDMNILVSDFKIQVETGPILALANFAEKDESAQSPPPVYEETLTTEQIEAKVRNNKEIQQYSKQVGGQTNINIEIKNVIICTPCANSANILAIRGVFDIKVNLLPQQSIDYIRDQIKLGQTNLINSYKLNQTTSINANLRGLEIFICNFDELKIKKFKSVNKRNILLPLEFKLSMNEYSILASEQARQFSKKTLIDTKLEKSQFKLTFTDVNLINQTVQTLLEDMKQKSSDDKQIDEVKNPKAQLQSVQNQTLYAQQQIISEEEKIKKELEDQENKVKHLAVNEDQINQLDLNADFQGFQIIIINDMNAGYVPVLDFNIFEMNAKMKQNNIQLSVTTVIQFSADYYNPRVSLWEPIIETVGFSIDYVKSDLSNIKQLITIEMNPNYDTFNVTFSTQFLSVLTKNIKIAQKEIFTEIKTRQNQHSYQIQQEEQGQDDDNEDNENIITVSPYNIRNETGYPIEIITDLSNLNRSVEISQETFNQQKIYQCNLNNNEEKNFQVDYQDDLLMGDPFKKETFVFKKQSEQVKVKVLVPGQNLKYIEQIDLDKARNRLRPCRNQDNQKLFDIITEVQVDKITSKKVLNISSPYYFINDCNKVLMVSVSDQRNNIKQTFKLEKDQRVPIPIDLLQGYFGINLLNDNDQSDRLSFQKLCKNFINKSEELKIGNSYFMLKIYKDPENEKRIMFRIEPPYRVKNCLPKTLLLQFMDQKKETAKTQEIPSGDIFEFYNCSQQKSSYIKISIPGHFWSSEVEISGKDIKNFLMKDIFDNESEIAIHHQTTDNDNSEASQGCKQFYIYCKGFLINETPYELNVYTSSQKKNKNQQKLIGGQKQIEPDQFVDNNILLFGDETGDQLSLADSKLNKTSKYASICGVGSTQVEFYTKNEQGIPIYETMGVSVSLKNVDFGQKLFSKVITISPRFIFVNKTGYSLEIKQKGHDTQIESISKDTRLPLHWYDDSENRFLNLRIVDDKTDWDWSGYLNVQELGTVNFMLRNKDNKMDVVFLRTDVRSNDSNIYVVIEKITQDEIPYVIKNLSKKVKMQLKDFDIVLNHQNSNTNEATANQQYYFSWDEPFFKERKVASEIIPLDGEYQSLDFTFSPDQIYFKDKIQILPIGQTDKKKNRDNSLYLKWSIDINGFTRIIKFEDSSYEEPVTQSEKDQLRKKVEKEQNKQRKLREKERRRSIKLGKEISADEDENENETAPEQNANIQQQISVFIKDFGLSIVQNHRTNEKPTEFLFLTIKGLEFISLTKEESKTLQLRLKLLNVDQNYSYSIVNPVVLTPQKFELYNKENSPNFFMNLIIEENLAAKNIKLYNNIAIEVNPFTLRIEQDFISKSLDFLKAIEEARFDPNDQVQNSLKEYNDTLSSKNKNPQMKKFNWQKCEIPPTSLPTFINQLILSNIQCALTFKAKIKKHDTHLYFLQSMFNALGVALTDIDASIKLRGVKLINCFDTVPGITSQLMVHYRDRAIREVLKACGSLNIIGNPVGLFSNISTGVIDLFQKPAEGFVKGPLEGGFGIMKGASSLIKNTMAGAFNSVNKITGSLSSGISALSMDDDYINERERMRQKKPKHFIDGAVLGVTSIVTGVSKGIAGIFLKPFEGAKKGGAVGMLKGLGKGVAGLIVKPVSSVLDAASSVAGGIKNTITYGDDKAIEHRMRYPRVFYGREGFYKEYIDLDAGMKQIMQLVQNGNYANDDFLQTFLIQVENGKEKQNIVLVITYEVIILFDEASQKEQWHIPTYDLVKVDKLSNGLNFTASNKIKQLKSTEAFIPVPNAEQREYIHDQINTLKFQLNEEKKIKQQDN